MSDTSGTPLQPRDSRLNPDDVAERSFSQVKRGYAEHEVRAFLRLVADELASATSRARELTGRVQSLEERLSMPTPPPSDQDLIAALGEETARVLGQARESAIELRTKAEEQARALVKEAQESTRQLRTTAQQNAETRARELEDAARARANEIVAEARTMRDRVLTDLGERRQELERQVSELRAGRGRLVETYQVVERALAQASRVLADEPATTATVGRAPAPAPVPTPSSGSERAQPVATDAATEAAPARERAGDDGEEGDQRGAPAAAAAAAAAERAAPPTPPAARPTPPAAQPGAPSARPAAPAVAGPAPAAAAPEAHAALGERPGDSRDVGAVFDRLRSERSTPDAEPATPAADAAAEPEPQPGAPEEPEPEPHAEPELAAEPEPDAGQLARRRRDDVLGAVAGDLARRAKRAVQDEQNDVLDGLRRQRGRIDTSKVLPASDEQVARWAHLLQPAVDRAYEAGRVAAGASIPKRGAAVPAALLSELTAIAVSPLRSRLEDTLASVDARTPADVEITIAQALGARYREWRTQELDDALGDVLAVAYARGVYDGAPGGARLRWIPEREGRCPDCDDNALEPTTKGETFPTGQVAPPAHPGCRCLLVVEPAA